MADFCQNLLLQQHAQTHLCIESFQITALTSVIATFHAEIKCCVHIRELLNWRGLQYHAVQSMTYRNHLFVSITQLRIITCFTFDNYFSWSIKGFLLIPDPPSSHQVFLFFNPVWKTLLVTEKLSILRKFRGFSFISSWEKSEKYHISTFPARQICCAVVHNDKWD